MQLTRLALRWRLAAALLTLAPLAAAQEDLKYQRRADHYEGIKPKPVSGFDIELLSAQADYLDQVEPLGERLQARFYLDRPRTVHFVVRELDYKHYYWLDKVEPKVPWRAGFDNVFAWPTADVLQRLRGLKLYDLGIVARLDKANPSADESVAPVLLYQSRPPQAVTGYVFYFRLRDDAMMKAAVYAEGGSDAIAHRRSASSAAAGRSPSNRTRRHRTPDLVRTGWVLSGYATNTNDPISQVVRFYHIPKVQ